MLSWGGWAKEGGAEFGGAARSPADGLKEGGQVLPGKVFGGVAIMNHEWALVATEDSGRDWRRPDLTAKYAKEAAKTHKGHKRGINFWVAIECGQVLIEEFTGFYFETRHLSCRHPPPTQICVERGGYSPSPRGPILP